MASTRASVSTRRSRKAAVPLKVARSAALAARISAVAARNAAAMFVQSGVALRGRTAGEHVGGGTGGGGGLLEMPGGFGGDVHAAVLRGKFAALCAMFPVGVRGTLHCRIAVGATSSLCRGEECLRGDAEQPVEEHPRRRRDAGFHGAAPTGRPHGPPQPVEPSAVVFLVVKRQKLRYSIGRLTSWRAQRMIW